MKKLIFVCPRFAEGDTVGGAETLFKALARRAAASGCPVTFLTTCARDHFSWRNEIAPGARSVEGMDVHYFPVDEDRDVSAFLRIQEAISRRAAVSEADERTWIANSVNSRALCDYLRAHAGDCRAILAGPYLFGLTYSASQVSPDKTVLIPCLHDEGFAYVRLIGGMFRSASGVMFNSEPEMELGQKLYGLPARRCAVVGMGLDAFAADPAAFAARQRLHSPYLVYCGRREAGKGTPLLLDYVSLFRRRTGIDLKLVLTGSGPVDAPGELRPHILDLGFVPESEKREAMAGAAAFCHPSVNESFGIVLLEAWLAGTPALVHARCAVNRRHCEKSGGGLWFASYPEFEEELQLLLRDSKLRGRMGASGRSYVAREYNWNAVENKFRSALEQFA